jgi:hypothetical protein
MVITRVMVEMAGWPALSRRFPERRDRQQLSLRWRSAQMGKNVNLNNLLTFSAGPLGLRMALPRLFAAGQAPITVPWTDIVVRSETRFMAPVARLSFGTPEVGSMTIDARLWQRLAAISPAHRASAPAVPPLPAWRLLAGWLWGTVAAGGFFYVTSRIGPGEGLPPALCFGFPAVMFGIAVLIRGLRGA